MFRTKKGGQRERDLEAFFDRITNNSRESKNAQTHTREKMKDFIFRAGLSILRFLKKFVFAITTKVLRVFEQCKVENSSKEKLKICFTCSIKIFSIFEVIAENEFFKIRKILNPVLEQREKRINVGRFELSVLFKKKYS